MTRLDSHQHFWRYSPAEYGWISDAMSAIRRDFLVPDLQAASAPSGITGSIAVQARQTLEETRWLLGLASHSDFVWGVVGWAPLCDFEARELLEEMAQNRKLRAVRHVLQDEPDERYMLREDFNRGISQLRPLGLAYDILIYERQLPQTIEFVDRHPEQIFILDHVAKPRIAAREFSPWRKNLAELARRPNVRCKLSGVVTEADHLTWSEADLWPYLEWALETFGPGRLMFGSDWPVMLVASDYGRWVNVVETLTSRLSQAEQDRIWSGTADEAYGLRGRNLHPSSTSAHGSYQVS
jgi:L-fuconolactonase